MMFFSEIVWIMVKRAMSFLDYIFTSTGYFFLNVIRKSVVIHTGLNYKPKIYAIVLNDLLTYKCTHSFNTWKLRSNALLPLKCQLEFKKPYYIILTSFINFCCVDFYWVISLSIETKPTLSGRTRRTCTD